MSPQSPHAPQTPKSPQSPQSSTANVRRPATTRRASRSLRPSEPPRPSRPRAVGVAAAAVAAAVVAGASAGPPPIRILTQDDSRTFNCTASDGTVVSFNAADGNFFATARTLLADPANFGPAGVVGRTTELLPSVRCLTEGALGDADVVFITNLAGDERLAPCEIRSLGRFVSAGGSIVALVNGASGLFAPITGADPEAPVGAGPATVVDPASPVISGPFGTVAGPFSLAFHRTCDDVGPAGSAFLASSGAVGTVWTIGAGRIIGFNDEEWMGDIVAAPCAAGQQPESMRQTMFLNAFAAAVPAPGFAYAPVDDTADVDCSGAVDFDDLIALLAAWGPCEPDPDANVAACPACPGDQDGDGSIGFPDLVGLLAGFGTSLP